MSIERIRWVDQAKAIAIFLVCLGHIHYLPSQIWYIIYSFHMPLFFLLSGMFSNEDVKLIKKFKTLIIPYFFFNFVYYIFRYIINDAPLWNDWIVRLLCFDKRAGMWFLPCLFCSQFIISLVIKVYRINRLIGYFMLFVITLIGVGYNYYGGRSLPLSLEISFIVAPFLFLGYKIKDQISLLNSKRNLLAVIIFYVFSVGGFVLLPNHHVDLFRGSIGFAPMFYLTAFLGCIMTLMFCYLFQTNNMIFLYVGRSTLIIYGLHRIFLKMFNWVYIVKVDNMVFNILMSFIESFIVVLLIIPIAKFIYKYIPFFIGKF